MNDPTADAVAGGAGPPVEPGAPPAGTAEPPASDVQGDGDALQSPEVASGSGSLMERLRSRREAIGDPRRRKDIDLPGYNGLLFARYQVIPGGWDRVKQIQEAAERSTNPRALLYSHCTVIAACCVGLYTREDGREAPLGGGPEPLTFADTQEVAAYFDFPMPKKTRGVVLGVFNNDIAVSAHQDELSEWIKNASSEDDEEFLGESSAQTR